MYLYWACWVSPLSFLRVFDVLVQYCLTSWSSPAPRCLWRQKNFNCSPVLSFLLMCRSNRSFNILPRDKPQGIWAFEHRFMQTPCSSSSQNCSNAQPTQLFRERQNRRPWSHTSHDHIAPRNSLPITIGKLFHGGMCCLFWSSRMNQYNFRCFVALVSRRR